ncbi:MAG: hypothetical protein HYS23_11010 [Geobacter sp.]|nr:hypothetical protein [Geobacter sp.]
MSIIHSDDRFEKSLDSLRRAGGEAAIAARRAETLIRALCRDEETLGLERRKRTRNGEARIENCRKYQLGGGYRLVCINRGNVLVPLQVGTHDDCDRWIENNRKLRIDVADDGLMPIEEPVLEMEPRADMGEATDDCDTPLMERLSQRELREIFRGLYER